MSKGEFTSVAQANGGIENMLDMGCKDQDALMLIKYIADEDKLGKIVLDRISAKTTIKC